MALWMTKPAGLTGCGVASTGRPCRSIFTRLEAVISSNSKPYGLIRKWCSGPGRRREIWVKIRSLMRKWAISR
ncbi:hypothetical protein D3C75_1313130 [compost metagenome]